MTPGTLGGFVADLAARYGEACAFVLPDNGGEATVSYIELRDRVMRAAHNLARAGLSRGDRLVLWLPNGIEWIVLHLAAASLGVCTVALNTRFRSNELASALAASEPAAIAIAPHFLGVDFAALLAEQLPAVPSVRTIVTTSKGGGLPFRATPYGTLLQSVPGGVSSCSSLDAADGVIAFTTSGTSAAPKLAVHDHAGVVQHAKNDARAFGFGAGDALLGYLPFCGVFGYCALMACLAGGATCIVEPVFAIEEAVELCHRFGVTHLFGSDVFLDALLAVPNVDDGRLSRLRYGGFADFAGGLTRALGETERRLGARFTTTYGSSECFALMTCWPPEMSAAERSRLGGALVDEGIEMRVVDAETGTVLGHNQNGELQFRGYNVLQRYLGAPEKTAAAFVDGGWFRTSDLGYSVDARTMVYLARLGDSLRLAGYLVDPREIEDFLMQHDAIAVAQVVGVPGERGDVPVAFVLPRDPNLTAADVVAYCRGKIAAYKIPHHALIVERFPTTPSANGEKIQKAKLRQMARTLVRDSDSAEREARGGGFRRKA